MNEDDNTDNQQLFLNVDNIENNDDLILNKIVNEPQYNVEENKFIDIISNGFEEFENQNNIEYVKEISTNNQVQDIDQFNLDSSEQIENGQVNLTYEEKSDRKNEEITHENYLITKDLENENIISDEKLIINNSNNFENNNKMTNLIDETQTIEQDDTKNFNSNSHNFIRKHSDSKEMEFLKSGTFDCLPEASQKKNPVSALTPIFSFGFNRHVPIINLSTDKRCFIFYSCSHLGIIYDYYHNEQLILQGHNNTITCTTASNDKRWLGTGDKGKNSAIIIWDCNTGLPVRTMFDPHPNGVVSICLTPDARYLATLSAENIQTFAIWDWTTGEDIPLCSSSLSCDYGIQNYISFNSHDVNHVTTNSETQVLFYQWDKIGNIKYFAPKLTDQDFNKPVGKFCNTLFLPKSTRALSATSQGLLVVWEGNVPLVKVSNESTPDKRAVKLVPVHDKAITVLALTNTYIVTGDIGGDVKFFDFNYMLMFWYQDWNFGPITSISSSINTNISRLAFLLENSDYPGDATIQNNKFVIDDFIVGTATTIFAAVTVKGSKIKVIFRDHEQSVYSVNAHPSLPLVATGSYSGLLKIWNYEKRESVKTRLFNKVPIKSLCFDHRGVQMAVGFSNGELRILDTYALKDVISKPFHFSKVHITHIQYSENSEFLATVDGNFTTTLFRAGNNKFEEQWVYVGRYRAHYKRILDLLFGRYFDTGTPRLFTLGEDRRLVEYDIYNASEDNLSILQEIRIEQSAIPLTMCWYPEDIGEGFLLTANDEYKLKLYNHQTKMCRHTFLGPTFGSPVKILKTLPAGSDSQANRHVVAYANHNKIGLIKTPLNGNPYNYMTMIAHPKGVTSLCCSFDGNYLISVGEDFIVVVWKINLEILEAQAQLCENEMSAFYELIEGGEFGHFIHELKDYFYYSMLRTQGIDSLQKRQVDIVIDISEVPYIMRAIGFYPSEEEIENMLNELKFKNYFQTGQYVMKVDLNTFLKLYINHRPAFGIASEKIEDAFRVITKNEPEKLSINKFLDLLMYKGENIVESDLAEYLATLLGFNEEGGSLEMEEFNPDKVMKSVNEALPKIVTAKTFIQNIICMKVVDKEGQKPSSPQKMKNSTSGTQT